MPEIEDDFSSGYSLIYWLCMTCIASFPNMSVYNLAGEVPSCLPAHEQEVDN